MPPPHLAQLGVWRPCVCVHTCWDLCVHGPVCLEVDAASPQHPRVCRQLVSSQAGHTASHPGCESRDWAGLAPAGASRDQPRPAGTPALRPVRQGGVAGSCPPTGLAQWAPLGQPALSPSSPAPRAWAEQEPGWADGTLVRVWVSQGPPTACKSCLCPHDHGLGGPPEGCMPHLRAAGRGGDGGRGLRSRSPMRGRTAGASSPGGPSGTVCIITLNPRLQGGPGPQPQGLGTSGNSWPTT